MYNDLFILKTGERFGSGGFEKFFSYRNIGKTYEKQIISGANMSS